jgi:hypothetical protein
MESLDEQTHDSHKLTLLVISTTDCKSQAKLNLPGNTQQQKINQLTELQKNVQSGSHFGWRKMQKSQKPKTYMPFAFVTPSSPRGKNVP